MRSFVVPADHVMDEHGDYCRRARNGGDSLSGEHVFIALEAVVITVIPKIRPIPMNSRAIPNARKAAFDFSDMVCTRHPRTL
jgi:hypothetical protein